MLQLCRAQARLSLRAGLALCAVTLTLLMLLQGSAVSAQQDLCQSSNCSGFGDCQEHGEFRVCSCVPGHAGFQCQFNQCSQHECFDRGTCSDNLCSCSSPYIGATCQAEACAPGAYFDVAQGICLGCPLGYYNPDPDSLFCLEAPPGMLTIDANGDTTGSGAVGTVPCPEGYECPVADMQYSCTPGTYAEGGASKCSSCPPGTFNGNFQASNCSLCSQGTYSDSEGAANCSFVPTGYYATRGEDLNLDGVVDAAAEGATSVLPCPDGHKCDDGMFTPCPAGTMPDQQQTVCADCPPHTFAPSPGTPSCTQCSADSYAEPGWDECLTVPAGYYRTAVGISPCLPGFACPGGSLQPSECRPGLIPVLGNSTCELCPVGTITRDGVTCTACSEPSQTSNDGITCFEVFQGCVSSVIFTTSNKNGRAFLFELPQPIPAVVRGQQLTFSIESSVDLATHVFQIGEQEVVFTADYLNNPTCTVTVSLTYGITQTVSSLGFVQDDALREVRDYILSDSSFLGGALVPNIDVQRESFAFRLVPEDGAAFTLTENVTLLGQATLQGHLSYCHASVPAMETLDTTSLTQRGSLDVSPFSAAGNTASVDFSESCFIASFDVPLVPLEPSFPSIAVEITFPSGSNFKRGQYLPNAHSGIWLRDPGPRYNTTDRPILTAVDADPPVFVYCPEDIFVVFAYGQASRFVTWLPAIAEDNVKLAFVEATRYPGTEFELSELPSQVTYTAFDTSDNSATCTFTVEADYPFWNEARQTTVVNAGQTFDTQLLQFDSQRALAFNSILGGLASAYFREIDLSHNRFRFSIEAEAKFQFAVAPYQDEVSLDIFLVFRQTQVTALLDDLLPRASDVFLRVTLKNARNARTEQPVDVPEGWFRDGGTSFSVDAIVLRGSGVLPSAKDGLLFTSIEFELSLPGLAFREAATTALLATATASSTPTITSSSNVNGTTINTSSSIATVSTRSSSTTTVGSTTTATWQLTSGSLFTTGAPYTRTVNVNGTTLTLADFEYSIASGHAGITRFADGTFGAAGASPSPTDPNVPAFFSVVGLDLEPPTITCPGETAVEIEENTGEAKITESVLYPTYSDDSGNVTITSNLNDTYPVGSYNVTFWAFDPYGNVAACTVLLHVVGSTGAIRAGGSGLSNAGIIGMAVGIVIFVLLTTTFFWTWRVKRLTRPKPYDFEERLQELAEHLRGEDGLIKPREIKRENIRQLEVLGAGHWGEVVKGILEEHKSIGIPGYLVAIKTLKSDSVDSQDELMREAAFMAQLNNDYVVKLYGVCTFDGPMMMVMEYCEHGSLQAFLRKNDMPVQQRVQVLCDAASGLLYLSSRGIVHRDIASRNVLLSSEWRGRIADFGMSRESDADSAYYHSRGGAVPVRWSAPEALEHHKFSEKSDMWSFGILCYETFTDAELPYKGMSNQKVWVNVMEGYRLPSPEGCPAAMYALMQDCWLAEADQRPTFHEVVNKLNLCLQGELGDECKGSADAAQSLAGRRTRYMASDRYANESSFLGKAAKEMDAHAASASSTNSTSMADSATSPSGKSTIDAPPLDPPAESYVDLTGAVHVDNATGQRETSPASRSSTSAPAKEEGHADVTLAGHVCNPEYAGGDDGDGAKPASHSGGSNKQCESSGRGSVNSIDEHTVQLYSTEHVRDESPASASTREGSRQSAILDFLNMPSPVVPPRPSLNNSRATTSPATTVFSINHDDDDDDDDGYDVFDHSSNSHYLEPTSPASAEPHYEDPPGMTDRRRSRLNHCETLAAVPATHKDS